MTTAGFLLELRRLQVFPLFGWAVSGRVGPRAGTLLEIFFALAWIAIAA